MQHVDTPSVRVAGVEALPRNASRRRRFVHIFTVAVPALIAAALWLGARQVLDRRAQVTERERLAQAAAVDRQSRDDQIRVWSVALNTDPNSALALAQLAALNVQKARETGQETYYPVAEEMARRSLTLRTHRNARTYVVLASTLLAQHRFSEARDAAAAAFALEPEVVQYKALLAEIDMELGDYGAAAQGFTGLAAYRTHLSIGPRLARWAEVTGKPAAARGMLQELVSEAEQRRDLPREQLAWFNFRLGDHYRRHGSPRRARASLSRALAVNPGDYRAHKALAELDLALGGTKSALKHARSAVSGSRTPETLLVLSGAFRESGDSAAARTIESGVATIIGADGGSFERAWHAYRLDWGIAADELVPLLDREVRERADVQGYDLLAWAYYKSGRIPQARAAISSALRTGTSDATVWYHAGTIFHASGDSMRASAYLRRALELNPAFHHRHARTARSLLKSTTRQAAAG